MMRAEGDSTSAAARYLADERSSTEEREPGDSRSSAEYRAAWRIAPIPAKPPGIAQAERARRMSFRYGRPQENAAAERLRGVCNHRPGREFGQENSGRIRKIRSYGRAASAQSPERCQDLRS